MKSIKFFYHTLIKKHLKQWFSFWFLELIIKNSYLNNYSERLFCQAI